MIFRRIRRYNRRKNARHLNRPVARWWFEREVSSDTSQKLQGKLGRGPDVSKGIFRRSLFLRVNRTNYGHVEQETACAKG